MGVVVSDTSPLRALHHLQLLYLISELYQQVLIPPAVQEELVRPRRRFPAIEISQIPGAVVQAPEAVADVIELKNHLQAGEAEAIVLAKELGAELLIDEKAGRTIARERGLRITGTVGLLVECRRRRLIPAVVPLLERLRSELGFYLSDELIREAAREGRE